MKSSLYDVTALRIRVNQLEQEKFKHERQLIRLERRLELLEDDRTRRAAIAHTESGRFTLRRSFIEELPLNCRCCEQSSARKAARACRPPSTQVPEDSGL